MKTLSNYLKSKEVLFSLIYIPLFISLQAVKGQYELIFAIISGIFILLLVVILINLSIKLKSNDSKSKLKSFIMFFVSNILILALIVVISILLIQNCRGGLCGLVEAETILLFITIQILSLLAYGLSLFSVTFLNWKK